MGLSIAAALLLGTTTVASADDVPRDSGRLLKAAAEMRKAEADLAQDASLRNRIRVLSWAMLVGETASAAGGPELFSAASDAFARGAEQLEILEKMIKERPELEDEISDSPEFAVRLDTVRVRLKAIEKKAESARTEERRRLSAFRQLVRSYRSLTSDLAAGNAEYLMGDHQQANKRYIESLKRLDELRRVVAQPRTHWLFKDEPRLDTDDATEADLILAPAAPFDDDLATHLKAMQALTALRTAVGDDSRVENAERLQTARQLAAEALDANRVANSGESGGVIPRFVMAEVDRCLGLQATRESPLSAEAHKQAAKRFASARTLLGEISPIVARPDGQFPGLRVEVARRIAEIESPDAFLSAAKAMSARGRIADAFGELGRGLTYHRSLELVLARAEAACRDAALLPKALEELQQAADDGLLGGNDPLAVLIRSRCELTKLRIDALGDAGDPQSDADRKSLQQTLDRISADLGKMQAKTPAGSPLRARLQAFDALARSYWSLLASGEPIAAEKDALRMAQSAAENIEAHLKTLPLQNPHGPVDEWAFREALIAARTAQGHLAVRTLPDYRGTSTLAFTAAMEHQNRLPFAGSATRLLGKALMASLLKRPEAQANQLSLEERQLRMVLAQFAESAFALHWNRPEDASEQMSNAMQRLRGDSSRPGIDLSDPSRLLAADSGVDPSTEVLEAIVPFTAMSHVAAGRSSAGLAVLLNHLAPAEKRETAETVSQHLQDRRLDSAVERVASPLLGYALGQALEKTVTENPGLDEAGAAACRRSALSAQKRVQELFADSPSLRNRYRFLIALNSDAIERLTNSRPFLESAHRLSSQFRFDEAVAEIRAGLSLHPTDERLLADLFRLAIGRVSTLDGEKRTKSLESALRDIHEHRATGRPALAFDAARILDMVGRRREALAGYEASLRDVNASEERRIVAESRIALLSALLAVE